MKKTILVLMLCLCATAIMAAGIPEPKTPRLMVDPTGSLVSDTAPLPVKVMSGIGSITVIVASQAELLEELNDSLDDVKAKVASIAKRISSYATATLVVTDTSQNVTIATGCKNIYFQNQGTGTVTIHTGTPAVSGSGWAVYGSGVLSFENIPLGQAYSIISATGESNNTFVHQEIE